MSRNIPEQSPTVAALPPDTRSNLEKKLAAEHGLSWADVHAAEISKTVNFSEESSASAQMKFLAGDDGPTAPKIQPKELGVPLDDAGLRLLAKMGATDGGIRLSEDEKERLAAAEHREHLDRTMALAVDAAKKIAEVHRKLNVAQDPGALAQRVLAGGGDSLTDAENAALRIALDNATVEYRLADTTETIEFHLSTAAEQSRENEALRRKKILELWPAIRRLQKREPIDTATSARLSRVNLGRILKLLREGTKLRDLPLDLVKNY